MSHAQTFPEHSRPSDDADHDSFADPMTSSPAPASAEPRSPSAGATIHGRRSPWIAAFLALFPGLGSVYNGSYGRGVAFFLTVFGLIYLAERSNELFGFAIGFVWLFNMIDAYREARLIQAGLADDLGVARQRPGTSAAEGLGLGAALLVIGLVAFLDATLGLDVDWVFELWPVAMMIAGGWFIWGAVRRMRRP